MTFFMKTTNLFLLILFFIFAFKCSDDDTPVAENNGLIGKWKLTEYLADPGDGSGKWQKVTDENSETIEFHADGRFTQIKGSGISSVPFFDSYKILDEKRLEMGPIDKSSSPHIWYYSNLSATELTIGYGCIEACNGKYVAVK